MSCWRVRHQATDVARLRRRRRRRPRACGGGCTWKAFASGNMRRHPRSSSLASWLLRHAERAAGVGWRRRRPLPAAAAPPVRTHLVRSHPRPHCLSDRLTGRCKMAQGRQQTGTARRPRRPLPQRPPRGPWPLPLNPCAVGRVNVSVTASKGVCFLPSGMPAPAWHRVSASGMSGRGEAIATRPTKTRIRHAWIWICRSSGRMSWTWHVSPNPVCCGAAHLPAAQAADAHRRSF